MANGKPLVSLIIPVYNEEDNLLPLYETVTPILATLSDRFDFEFVFTDNHSTDKTPDMLRLLARADSRIRAYRFSRNVGYQRSILTAYLKCTGDAAIQLDCDLQDPPSLIPVFLDHWLEGNDVVYGIRKSRVEGWKWRAARRVFYWIVDFLSEDHIPQNAGDFRLISRRVIQELGTMDHGTTPYLRGTIATLGFKQLGVDYARAARTIGETKFSVYDNVMLALDGIINQSVVPLRVGTYIGVTVSLVTVLAIIGYLIAYFTVGFRAPAGFTTITTLILGSLSINAMLLGILGEYLGRMYLQMKHRSISIVERELHVD
ncbi:dolichol-phosphate mannosyltransferase [Granulicella pectinivorans]|uniref:Dolichol-phosphate mannosyltransferase n=1 Tax=Granulicella pectinivorans TaxID=474950 RepID=A0A1I6KZV6_9BACT|nr:glycosyltransferase family 2 protein [Granulicella pectinivorans]SFR96745.1 dolichol-phosphate mannosyltransferase [Granulicella pectinivorans]